MFTIRLLSLLSAFLLFSFSLAAQMQKNPKIELNDYDMVFIQGGTYNMGSTCDYDSTWLEFFIDMRVPMPEVTLGDFYIGRYEVTQKLWSQVMDDNPSYFKSCNDCPVEQVSWDNIQIFVKKLNNLYPDRNYRLPTEAEWEYAARGGGKQVLFGSGKNIADPKEINFDARKDYKRPYSIVGIYRKKTVPVGSLNTPNSLGLHDMSGNVMEWCLDWFGNYHSGPLINPTGFSNGYFRVVRGGAWDSEPLGCRVSNRSPRQPEYRSSNLGFRLVRTK